MGRKTKTKLSKKERKAILSSRGKAGAEARGIGDTSRHNFVLPRDWSSEVTSYASSSKVKFSSPGKTPYYSYQKAKDVIRKRGRTDFIDSSESENSESELHLSRKKVKTTSSTPITANTATASSVVVERQLFVCESSQILTFVENVNKTSRCSTKDCNGKTSENAKYL